MPKALIVAAPFSGAGKTLISCGLIAAWRQRGLKVAPFKIGPDYIDPGYLSRVAGRPCYNLDSWMLPEEALRRTLARGLKDAEVGVVEGVMGLFDGLEGGKKASTAEIAAKLGLPILLVFHAQGCGGTIAALIKGLTDFDPKLKFSGVVMTGVGSKRHEAILRRALEAIGVKIWGAIPRDKSLTLPSRHLGLVQAQEIQAEFFVKLAQKFEEYVDIKGLLASLPDISPVPLHFSSVPPRVRLAVAKDEAFSFYYQENLDLLQEAGAELVYFSPLRDPLPEAQGYYFGGGYPELFLPVLSQREDLWRALRHKVLSKGAPLLAECGGFMALCTGIKKEGRFFRLGGLIPGEVNFSGRLEALGYRIIQPLEENFLLSPPERALGHEFRYSRLCQSFQRGFRVKDARGKEIESFGLVESNLFTSYVHLHFASQPQLAENFVRYATLISV